MFGRGSDKGYKEILKGISIKTLVHGEKTLMSEFQLKKGSELTEHEHVHEQTGYLVKGKIRLFIGDTSRIVTPGDSWCIPSRLMHKAEILEDSVAIEIFSPYREEYSQFINYDDVEK
jgi:quercetin dioxygenase-like cupin family protein